MIFTDTHAELNGHSSQNIRQYFDEVADGACERGFESCWLGDLTKAAETDNTSPLIDETVPEPTFQRLLASAMKWYRGNGSCEEGALEYYRMNMVEKRAVEHAFPELNFHHLQWERISRTFPKNLPNLLHVFASQRDQHQTLVPLPGDGRLRTGSKLGSRIGNAALVG
ncbi:hypothetical protein [Bradyrhizobium sp. BR 1432]|uniref:hypothetical protein n=1 Tax=Bradyrhizobium sp. BR 1432 TaxID=3447966 RepID=UPI003EE5A5BC